MTTVDRSLGDRPIPPAPAPGIDVPDGLPRGIDLGRVVNKERALARFGPELVYTLTDHCLQGDDLAYRALQSFRSLDARSGWRLFEKALEHGIEAVDDPPGDLVALFEQLDHVPDWVDDAQLYRGAIALWRAGPIVPMILAYPVIGVGFSGYGATRPLLFSRRMMEREAVGQRMIESFRFVVGAYTPGGMSRFGDGFKHTARVRMIHARVRLSLSRSAHWDWENWGIPINNFDAMHTQCGIFGVELVDALARSGVALSAREREDIFALTRYVGYVIGVPEEILHTGEEDARLKDDLHKLVDHPADDACREIIHSLIDFSCEESLGGYDVLPAWLAKVMTPDRRKKLSHGLIQGWQPASVTAQMDIPRDHWRFVLPAVRPFMRAADRVARLRPQLDERRARKVLAEFNVAIAIAMDGDEHPLAEPEELASDIQTRA